MGCNCSGCPDEDIAAGVITIVEVPEGVTMGGDVTAALPPPQPVAPRKTHKTAMVRASYIVKRLLPAALSSVRTLLTANMRTNPSANIGSTRCPEMGVKRTGIEGGSTAPPLVDTVTVNGDGAPFATGTFEGT